MKQASWTRLDFKKAEKPTETETKKITKKENGVKK